MKKLLPYLLGFAMLCVPILAEAQSNRPNESFYLRARLGVSAYGGERDMNSNNNLGDILSNTSFPGFGFEVGYTTLNIEPVSAGVGIAYHGGTYENITTNLGNFPTLDSESSDFRHTIGIIGQLGFFPTHRLSPYLRGGLGYSFGSVTPQGGDSETVGAFSPIVGLGVDLALNDKFSLFAEATGAITSPDDEIDAADGPDADILGFLGGGVRYNFVRIYEPVQIRAVDGPSELEVGEEGTFTATTNPEATPPVERRWDFGDGTTGTGENVTHTFSEEGQYTVTFMASNEENSVSESITVDVVPAPVPAEIVTINATPSPAEAGQRVNFSSNVRGDTPVDYSWDFGDGSTGEGAAPTHVYDEAGTYEVTLTASNEVGEDSRSLSLTVEPALAEICTEVTEFNAAYFGRNSSTLTEEGRSELQENLDILSQCPNLNVRVEGYSSPFERNTQALSEDRARAVAQFYQDNGIASSRITTQGMGEVEGVTSKKGGTDQLRRADSIPVQREN